MREKEKGGRKREALIACSTYLCIHWLILMCALTGNFTRNLGVLGHCSNPGVSTPGVRTGMGLC